MTNEELQAQLDEYRALSDRYSELWRKERDRNEKLLLALKLSHGWVEAYGQPETVKLFRELIGEAPKS